MGSGESEFRSKVIIQQNRVISTLNVLVNIGISDSGAKPTVHTQLFISIDMTFSLKTCGFFPTPFPCKNLKLRFKILVKISK